MPGGSTAPSTPSVPGCWSTAQGPLLQSLHAQGLLRPYRLGGKASPGADVDMRTLRAVGSRHLYVVSMLLWGPGFFTSSAFMMAHLVRQLLGQLYPAADRHSQAPPR
jgi:hypothetical protein